MLLSSYPFGEEYFMLYDQLQVKREEEQSNFGMLSNHLLLGFIMLLQASVLSLPRESLSLDLLAMAVATVYYFLKIDAANKEAHERVAMKYKSY